MLVRRATCCAPCNRVLRAPCSCHVLRARASCTALPVLRATCSRAPCGAPGTWTWDVGLGPSTHTHGTQTEHVARGTRTSSARLHVARCTCQSAGRPCPPHLATPGRRDRLARLRGSSVELDLARSTNCSARSPPSTRSCGRVPRRAGGAGGRGAQAWSPGEPRAGCAPVLRGDPRDRTPVLGLRPFDVQIVAALAWTGRIAESRPARASRWRRCCRRLQRLTATASMSSFKVLARRMRSGWGPLYRASGCRSPSCRGACRPRAPPRVCADVTYSPPRNRLRSPPRSTRQAASRPVTRPFHFALIDEADSILIDRPGCRS